MNKQDFPKERQAVADAWNANAAYWDHRMGEGNDFVEVLCWPALERLLAVEAGEQVLDVACGNGLTSRRLGRLGAVVTAFDVSAEMIRHAERRTSPEDGAISYRVLDACDEEGLLRLGVGQFDGALSNMALFDMAEIAPLFRALAKLLRPGGRFVFSVVHPCFNQTSTIRMAEFEDRQGELVTAYRVKTTQYMTPRTARALAIRGQPEPHPNFDRPLHMLLGAGFEAGFVVDGLEERAFPPDMEPRNHSLSWGANFSEIPPVMVVRMRRP
ncbi:MAG: class I SAM-dependent methyltransferase [Caldilineae bacterium]|nr:MAG: class I SAM-dependent methyltransferase [Caldilineae bacterium]